MGFGWDVCSVAHLGDLWGHAHAALCRRGLPGHALRRRAADGEGGLWLAYHVCDYGRPVAPPLDAPGLAALPCRPTFSKHAVEDDAVLVQRVALPAARQLERKRPGCGR